MPSTSALSITVSDLPRSQANAIHKKADRLGITPAEYVRQLIAADIRLEREASSKTFAELAMPFTEALAGIGESDLDALADGPRKRKALRGK